MDSVTPASRTGGAILAESLVSHGVDRVFCIPGESYLPVLDALRDVPIEVVVARHEGAAANMAEADGKLTGRPGVCLVTRGPGATHASVGVHTAMQDSTPMILFVGQVDRAFRGREAFQEIDYRQMFASVAKWVAEIDDIDRIGDVVGRAFTLAVTGRPGPVVVSLPEDLLFASAAVAAGPVLPVVRTAPDPSVLAALSERLGAARRPLVIVGGSGWTGQARADLAAFVRRHDLPVMASFRRQDILDNADPHYAGHLGLSLAPALAGIVREADLLLALGPRLGETTTQGYGLIEAPRPHQALVHAHADLAELGRVYQPDLALCASPADLAAALGAMPALAGRPWSPWRARCRQAFDALADAPGPEPRPGFVDLRAVVRTLSAELPDDAVVTNGAGNYTVWLHRFWRYGGGRRQLAPTSGAMGYGLSAAIAAKLRHPGRAVLCFAGDGCFMMYPQELVTAVQEGATIVVLVVNNGMYGTIRMHQERHYPNRSIATGLLNPDFVGFARSCGARAERVTDTGAVWPAVKQALRGDLPTLIELQTDPNLITPDRRLVADALPSAAAFMDSPA